MPSDPRFSPTAQAAAAEVGNVAQEEGATDGAVFSRVVAGVTKHQRVSGESDAISRYPLGFLKFLLQGTAPKTRGRVPSPEQEQGLPG